MQISPPQGKRINSLRYSESIRSIQNNHFIPEILSLFCFPASFPPLCADRQELEASEGGVVAGTPPSRSSRMRRRPGLDTPRVVKPLLLDGGRAAAAAAAARKKPAPILVAEVSGRSRPAS